MCDTEEEYTERKPLSREVLEEFANRCARMDLYKGTSEQETVWEDIYWVSPKSRLQYLLSST